MAAQNITQMQATIDAMNRTVQDLVTEVVQLRVVASQAHRQVELLTQKSTDAWGAHTKRIDDLAAEVQDVQSKVIQGGGNQGEKKHYWNLDTKGQVVTLLAIAAICFYSIGNFTSLIGLLLIGFIFEIAFWLKAFPRKNKS